jgi:hypothetical protein
VRDGFRRQLRWGSATHWAIAWVVPIAVFLYLGNAGRTELLWWVGGFFAYPIWMLVVWRGVVVGTGHGVRDLVFGLNPDKTYTWREVTPISTHAARKRLAKAMKHSAEMEAMGASYVKVRVDHDVVRIGGMAVGTVSRRRGDRFPATVEPDDEVFLRLRRRNVLRRRDRLHVLLPDTVRSSHVA